MVVFYYGNLVHGLINFFPEVFDFYILYVLTLYTDYAIFGKVLLVDQTVPFAHFYYVAHMVRFLFERVKRISLCPHNQN